MSYVVHCLLSFEDIQTQATTACYNVPSLMCVRLAWVGDVSAFVFLNFTVILNRKTMKYTFISTLLIIYLCIGCNSSMFDSDSCFTFGSGNVFPGGARKIDHKLQFTKAMSAYLGLYIPNNHLKVL